MYFSSKNNIKFSSPENTIPEKMEKFYKVTNENGVLSWVLTFSFTSIVPFEGNT